MWQTLTQVEETYQRNLQAFLRRDTEELPAIDSLVKQVKLPLSLNTCARINALIQYAKGLVIECAYENEMIPVGSILIHPHYDDMLLVGHKDMPDQYLMLPGYTVFSMRFYERLRE